MREHKFESTGPTIEDYGGFAPPNPAEIAGVSETEGDDPEPQKYIERRKMLQ